MVRKFCKLGLQIIAYLKHGQCFIWELLVLAFIKSASPICIYLFEHFFQIWKLQKAGLSGLILGIYCVQSSHPMPFLDFLALIHSKNIKFICCLRGVTSSNCPRFTKIYSFLLIPHAYPASLKYTLSVNDACDLGHVWNFVQYIYFSVLVSSAIAYCLALLDIPYGYCTQN